MKPGKSCLTCPEILTEEYGRTHDKCAQCLYEEKNPTLSEKIRRLELVDHRVRNEHVSGRIYIAQNCKVDLMFQDGGETLKVFVTDE